MPKPSKPIKYKEAFHCIRLDTPCHICVSHKPNTGGYIPYRINNKKVLYHRYIYEKHFGEIEKGLQIRHKCDQPSCINIDHLEIGTPIENAQDKVSRGRWAGNVKIKDQHLEYINNHSHSLKFLAKKLKVSIATVSRHRNKIRKKSLMGFNKTIKMFNEILEDPIFENNQSPDILSIKTSIIKKISECLQELNNYKDYINEDS